MGTHEFGYTYRHLCSYCVCLESNTPSSPLQIVAGLDNGSVRTPSLLSLILG